MNGTTMLLTLGVTLYTVNYGRWMWRRGHPGGALGLWLLAAATLASGVLTYVVLSRG